MSERRIVLEKTKKGYPAIWEEGGGYTNTGSATVVASADGSPKKPVYIRKRGDLACREHALIIVEKGDYIVQANHHRRDFEINIYKVINIIDEYHQEDRRGDLIERISREEFRQRYGKDIKELPKLLLYSWDHYELPECPGIVFFHDRINDYVNIRKIENITMVTTYAEVELVNKFDCGEWEADLDSSLAAVVDASKEKALCYHCRGPHYVQDVQE